MTSYPELSRTIPGIVPELSRPLPIGEDSSGVHLKAELSPGQLGSEASCSDHMSRRVKVTGDLFHGQIPDGVNGQFVVPGGGQVKVPTLRSCC